MDRKVTLLCFILPLVAMATATLLASNDNNVFKMVHRKINDHTKTGHVTTKKSTVAPSTTPSPPEKGHLDNCGR